MGDDQLPGLLDIAVGQGHKAVTPSNTVDLPHTCRALFVGGAGDVKFTAVDGETETWHIAIAPFIIPVAMKRVWADSTATLMIAIK